MEVEEKMSDRLIVTADGQVQEVPIYIYPSAPDLQIDHLIDFGTLVIANKVISKQITITNEGSKLGEFKLVYNGSRPLNIVPYEGCVYPQSSIPIQVEYVTHEAHKIDEKCLVAFEGSDPFEIAICGDVVNRSLELLDVNSDEGKPIKCIKFPYTYYGSDKSEMALLFNNSPEKIQFVAILEEDAVGQESGSHITMTTAGIDPKECTNPLTSLITMYPNQGILKPYEKVPVLFRFSPRWSSPKQAFKMTLEPPLQQTFAVFVKIQIVGSGSETDSNVESSKAKEDSLAKSQQLEVAITGTAAPVLIEMEPNGLDFGECSEQSRKIQKFNLYNRSSLLSTVIDFPREAHFVVEPKSVKIAPNEKMQISVIFNPKQYGNFNAKQVIKVLSYVKDQKNPFVEYEQTILEKILNLSGSCVPIRKTVDSKYCNGLDPLITNKIGYFAETTFCNLGNKPNAGPIAAYITTDAFASGGTKGSSLFRCNDATINPFNNRTASIAFPNDRAESIRPFEQNREFRTIMKRIKRYNYIDPDYAYNDEEMRLIRQHKDAYQTLIRRQHMLKKISKLNSKFASFEDDLNLGIIPGNGLVPPRLGTDEIRRVKSDNFEENKNFKLLSSKDLKQSEKVVDMNKLGIFNAVPTTNEEKEQCAMVLSPQQLHQIIIGPSNINFGDTCIRSISNKDINIVNNLDQFIHVSVIIDCKELRQSSPLSQVISAKTKSNFPLVFESFKKGKFQRNISYVINGYYQNHVIVLANVVMNELQLSTDCLLLTSSPIYPPDSGIRNTITMTNPLNCATEFLWQPVFNSTNGIAFSIRPKEGVVEAFSTLDCEVVFHPSFMAPSEGDFILRIPGNDERSMDNSTQDTIPSDSPSLSFNEKANITIHCIANLGIPHVAFQSRRVMFGNIPINLATSRSAIMLNTGGKHGYFRIIPDALYEEYPGMTINPLKGSIPVGGQAEITIRYLPTVLTKFDCSVPIIIRGWKELELKLSGTVIIPQIEIMQKRLDFGGVPVGSEKILPFNLINKSQCRAEVEFNFMKHKDFTISSANLSENEKAIINFDNHECLVMLKPLQDILCQLVFSPKEVASYEFPLSVKINQVEMSLPQFDHRGNSVNSSKTPGKGPVHTGTTSTPATTADKLLASNLVRTVSACATRQLVSILKNKFQFQSSSNVRDQSRNQKLVISNNMDQATELCLKFSSASWKYGTDLFTMKSLSKPRPIPFQFSHESESISKCEDFIVTFSTNGETVTLDIYFEPDQPGYYDGELSVFVNNNFEFPYQRIFFSGFFECSRLICQPDYLTFISAPLNTEVSLDFKILALNFEEATSLYIELPAITKPVTNEQFQPFKCILHTSNDILAMTDESKITEIRGTLTFSSDIPINVRSSLEFLTESGIRKSVNLNASADNCQLSWHTFINKHQADYHIICDEGKHLEGTEISKPSKSVDFGEAQLKILNKDIKHFNYISDGQSHSRNSTTVTSSNFEESSVTYEETGSENESAYIGTPVVYREGALNNNGERVKFKSSTTPSMKQNHKPAEGSIGSTLEFSSSVISEKNYVNMYVPPNMVLGLDESDSVTSQSSYNKDFDIPTNYDADLLLIAQRWFTMHGWPGNLYPINVPNSFRSSLQKRFGHSQTATKDKQSQNSENMDNTGLKNDSRDLYDMILYLTGRQILGINTTVCLPTHPVERACHIYIQHATLIAFIENQGGQLAQVRPEHLMDSTEYELWFSVGCPGLPNKDDKHMQYDLNSFEKISKKAWTTVLLQILKVFILIKVTYKSYKHALQILHGKDPIPEVQLIPTVSNCYSFHERILLAWLNYLYESFRHKCWPLRSDCSLGTVLSTPVARWIINFDNDFMDSLILATAIGAYVPFMIDQHFKYMYSNPQNPEQCLHNALKVVNALKDIGLEYDIQAIDIVDPNPIMMILFTMTLFQSLPLYLPKAEILFSGVLHEQITKQILISNPTNKPLAYECIIIGKDSSDFSSPKGNIVNLSGKGSMKWPIVFKSRFIRSVEATVMFVGRKSGSVIPANLIFTVKSKITSTNPAKFEKISEKCYIRKKINLKITSPYNKSGNFKVKLIESSDSNSKENHQDIKSAEQSQIKPMLNKKTMLETIKPQNRLRAFSCHAESIEIDDNKSGTLEMYYLPFHLGTKRCTIIFSNDEIGEFVQCIEATAELPEPIIIKTPIDKSKSSIWVSAAEAANRGLEGNENTIYWRCNVGVFVDEILSIPISNPNKQQALRSIAQLYLSAQEVSRRQVTGTLSSNSLLLTAVSVLTLPNDEKQTSTSNKKSKNLSETKYSNKGKLINFEIELDSTFYSTPSIIQIPDPLQNLADDITENNKGSVMSMVDIPIKFHASTAGIYPCNLILKGPDDVRLFRIECTVTPEGNLSQIFFKTALQDFLAQNIPIVNKTKQDWPLRATITGAHSAFSGSDFIMAKALSVSQYPLIFRPVKEGKITAKLTLFNEADGSEHIFELFGEGESPLALDSLNFECSVGEKINTTLQIPNSTRKKHVFSVESDLDWMITGDDAITVLPGRSAFYELTINPKRSGKFRGILAFVSGKKKIKEYDSDGDEIEDVYAEEVNKECSTNSDLYRVWFSVVIDIHPGPPQEIFTIACRCLQTITLDIPITNPSSDDEIQIQADIQGPNLSGDEIIMVKPKMTENYSLIFAPSAIGDFEGRLVFYNETIGEFWFKLNLNADPPVEVEIPMMNCELGKWSLTEIPVINIDKENKLLIYPEMSNPECFNIHIQDFEWFNEAEQCLSLPPNSKRNLLVRFTPCEIGAGAHGCVLTLKSKVLGDWKFHLTGYGLLPIPSDVIGVSANAGSNMTFLIPFHNPLLEPVLIDIKITEEHQGIIDRFRFNSNHIENNFKEMDSGVFKLLLKSSRKVKLEAKQSIEIPISFAPQEMRKYEGICSVAMRRKNGEPLISGEDFEKFTSENSEISLACDKNILRWLFPIKGVPEALVSLNVFTTPLIQGSVRAETKERLEFNLWGLPPPVTKEDFSGKIAKSAPPSLSEGNEQLNRYTQEFTTELKIINVDNGNTIDSETLNEYVKIFLIMQKKQLDTGVTILTYEFRMKPLRKFRLNAELIVTSLSGGVWRFPVRFVAQECEPDDEIVLEAIGLNKPVSAKFYLSSKTFETLPFKAYFLNGGDPDFSVFPESGILPAMQSHLDLKTVGLEFKVTWLPKTYSRSKGARLVVETEMMEWIYKFVGISPQYVVPDSNSIIQSNWDSENGKERKQRLEKKKNYIRQNIELLSTAVSSPIKGAPMFPRIV